MAEEKQLGEDSRHFGGSRRGGWIPLVLGLAALAVLAAVASVWVGMGPASDPSVEAASYHFDGPTQVNIDAKTGGRTYELQDIPKNPAEEAVAVDFLCTITADFEKMQQVEGETEYSAINLENEKRAVEAGESLNFVRIHQLATFTEAQIPQDERQWASDTVQTSRLKSWRMVEGIYTVRSPNGNMSEFGDGTFRRDFIVGETEEDTQYRIYDWGMPYNYEMPADQASKK